MNVYGIRYLLILLLAVVTITGCEEPDVSMASLGKKFQAPSLTGASPFDQDMNTNGYVRFQGSCNVRVSTLSISFDEDLWFIVPAVPNITGTNLTGSEVNDNSCENDGQFDFYLTENEMTSWGFDPDVEVDVIYIRGSTILGETQVLKLIDHSGPGGGNGGAATQVVLEKTWPMGFAGSSQCEYFNASVRNANNYTVPAPTNITFTLDKQIASTLYRNSVGYSSYEDCNASLNPKTVFTIPAGKTYHYVYYRFPDAPLDGTINFRAFDVSLAKTDSNYIAVTLRDSAGARYWMSSHAPHKVGKGMCTKGNFEARYYNGTPKYLSAANAWVPVVTGTNASKLFFYSDENCVNKITAIDGTAGNTSFYFKYTGAETDTSTLTLTINHTIDIGNFGVYDDIPQKLEIDRTGNTTVSHVEFHIQDTVTRAVCNQTHVSTHNSQGTLVTPNINIGFTSTANTTFYLTESDCNTSTNSVNATSITSPQSILYYRTLGAPGSTQSISIASTGLTTSTRSFVISDKATTVSALFNGLPDFIYPAADVCTLMKVEAVLSDTANDGTIYTNNFGEGKTITVQLPSGYSHYTDPGCTASVGGNSLGFNLGAGSTTTGQFTFYMKANVTPMADQFYVYQTSGGASGYLGSSSPKLLLGP